METGEFHGTTTPTTPTGCGITRALASGYCVMSSRRFCGFIHQAQVLDRVEDALLVEQALGEQGLEYADGPVIAVHSLDQRIAILDQQPVHRRGPRPALVRFRIRVREKRTALAFEAIREFHADERFRRDAATGVMAFMVGLAGVGDRSVNGEIRRRHDRDHRVRGCTGRHDRAVHDVDVVDAMHLQGLVDDAGGSAHAARALVVRGDESHPPGSIGKIGDPAQLVRALERRECLVGKGYLPGARREQQFGSTTHARLETLQSSCMT